MKAWAKARWQLQCTEKPVNTHGKDLSQTSGTSGGNEAKPADSPPLLLSSFALSVLLLAAASGPPMNAQKSSKDIRFGSFLRNRFESPCFRDGSTRLIICFHCFFPNTLSLECASNAALADPKAVITACFSCDSSLSISALLLSWTSAFSCLSFGVLSFAVIALLLVLCHPN